MWNARGADIDRDDVRSAVDEFENPAMADGVTVRLGKQSVRLSPEQYARTLSLEPRDGVLAPQLDEEKLFALVDDKVGRANAPVRRDVSVVHCEKFRV